MSKKKDPYPIRMCPASEIALAPALPQEWNVDKKVLVQFLGQYDAQNLYSLVPRTQLTPYYGSSSTDCKEQWCPNTVEQYVKALQKKSGKNKLDAVQLRVEELYLDKILEKARDNERKLAQAANTNNNDEEEEVEKSLEQESSTPVIATTKKPKARRIIKSLNGAVDNNEKLRAGDVIEYTHPQFVDGRPEGYREATVLSIQKREYPLVLDNGEFLPRYHRIRRIQRLVRGKLVEYNGKIRAICDHSLQYDKTKVNVGAGLAKEGARVASIVDKNMAKYQDKLQETGIPLDLLNKMTGNENNDESTTNGDCKMPATVEGGNVTPVEATKTSESLNTAGETTTAGGTKRQVSESPTDEDSSVVSRLE